MGMSARSAACHRESSKPGCAHPAISMRASYTSPSYSLLERIGPFAVAFHFSDVPNFCIVPSVYSTIIVARHLGKPMKGVL